jgi:hypothetical protein
LRHWGIQTAGVVIKANHPLFCYERLFSCPTQFCDTIHHHHRLDPSPTRATPSHSNMQFKILAVALLGSVAAAQYVVGRSSQRTAS